MWAQITAILFAGGLMLIAFADHSAVQAFGLISLIAALLILFYSFKEVE